MLHTAFAHIRAISISLSITISTSISQVQLEVAMPTIFQAMEIAKIAPWHKFDCLGGCCTFIGWGSVGSNNWCVRPHPTPPYPMGHPTSPDGSVGSNTWCAPGVHLDQISSWPRCTT